VSPSFRIPRRLGALVIAVAITGCGNLSLTSSAEAAARVNGHRISQSTLDSELHAILANANYTAAIEQSQHVTGVGGKGTFDLAFVDKVLARQILLELVHEEVARRHLVVTPDDLKAATDAQRSQVGGDRQGRPLFDQFTPAYQALLVRRAAEVTALQDALANVKLDDASIQGYYNAHLSTFTDSCESHILVSTQAQATQIRTQLVGGADFATLARQSSIDSTSAPKGGDLGCAPPRTYDPAFEQAVSTLAVGQLSPVVPLQAESAFDVIKVTDRKVEPLSSVRSKVIQQMQRQGSTQLSQFVQDSAVKAKITVSPRYGKFEATGPQAGTVVPPSSPSPELGGVTPTTPTSAPSTPPTSGP
jgi:parvulin-like peptidyl-prolyl isomerase